MRLWHKALIPYLPRQQLLGQWRECCAIAKNIAEKGTPNHVLVNRVLDYSKDHFYAYAISVWDEMRHRGYEPDLSKFEQYVYTLHIAEDVDVFSGWHNDRYLRQCLANLQEKYDCGAIQEEEWQRITDKYPEWK